MVMPTGNKPVTREQLAKLTPEEIEKQLAAIETKTAELTKELTKLDEGKAARDEERGLLLADESLGQLDAEGGERLEKIRETEERAADLRSTIDGLQTKRRSFMGLQLAVERFVMRQARATLAARGMDVGGRLDAQLDSFVADAALWLDLESRIQGLTNDLGEPTGWRTPLRMFIDCVNVKLHHLAPTHFPGEARRYSNGSFADASKRFVTVPDRSTRQHRKQKNGGDTNER